MALLGILNDVSIRFGRFFIRICHFRCHFLPQGFVPSGSSGFSQSAGQGPMAAWRGVLPDQGRCRRWASGGSAGAVEGDDSWRRTDRTGGASVRSHLLRCARDEGVLDHDPTAGIRPLRHVSPKRPLFTTDQVERLATVAVTACPRSGRMLADFLRLCAYSGVRCGEALRLRWEDVRRDLRKLGCPSR